MFVCAACENMNECTPKYNVFICCKCRRNVTYPLGISNLIKCNGCKTVNKVPISIGGQSNQNYQQYSSQQPVIIRVPPNAQTNVRISNTNKNTNQNSYPYQQYYQQPSYQQPNFSNNNVSQPKQ
jgi:LSD1 subclass zinc finger protein